MGLDLPQLIKEIKEARQGMEGRDAAMAQRFDALTTKYQGLEEGLDALHVRLNRPGGGAEGFGDRDLVRKSAREYVLERRAMLSPKDDGGGEYEPRGDEIDSAIAATKALRKVIRYGAGRLDALETKSLSEFNFGSIGWVLPSQWSSRVLSCLVDGTDLTSYVAQEGISGPSLKLAIDNLDMGQAAWACETSCFANNSQPNLAGLGEMEIKAESLRFAVCSTTNLLEDSAIRIEEWLQGKVANAFRDTISCALIVGDGIGRPQGLLHPSAGIPVCDTSPNTPAGTFTWQDLIMLAFEVPMKWQGEAVFLMNQKTLALCLTLSDGIAAGHPAGAGRGRQLPRSALHARRMADHRGEPDARRGAGVDADFVRQSAGRLTCSSCAKAQRCCRKTSAGAGFSGLRLASAAGSSAQTQHVCFASNDGHVRFRLRLRDEGGGSQRCELQRRRLD